MCDSRTSERRSAWLAKVVVCLALVLGLSSMHGLDDRAADHWFAAPSLALHLAPSPGAARPQVQGDAAHALLAARCTVCMAVVVALAALVLTAMTESRVRLATHERSFVMGPELPPP